MAAHGDGPPTSQPATLAELLRGLRQRSLLTQEELAERSGLSVRTIRGLELGQIRRPHSGSVRRLAEALRLSGPEREALVAAANAARARPAAERPHHATPTTPRPAPKATRQGPTGGQRRRWTRPALAAGLLRRPPRWLWSVALLAVLAVALGRVVASVTGPVAGSAAPSTAGSAAPSTGPAIKPLPARIRSAGSLIVSSQDALAPIVFVEPGIGRFRGLDYDLAQAMGERLGVEFRFRKVAFTHSFRELREGRSDIAMSVFRDINPEPDLAYVHYLQPGTAFLLPRGNPSGIRSRDDLCGRTVARPLTMPAEALARQSRRCAARGAPKITLMTCPTVPDPRAPVRGLVVERRCPAGPEPLRHVQRLVAERRADAAMLDLPLAEHAMRTAGAARRFELARLGVDAGPYGIVVRKADQQLADALRSALQAIIADGTYGRILARWGLGDRALPATSAPAAARGPSTSS